MNSEFEQILNHYYVIMINLLLSDNNSSQKGNKFDSVFSVFLDKTKAQTERKAVCVVLHWWKPTEQMKLSAAFKVFRTKAISTSGTTMIHSRTGRIHMLNAHLHSIKLIPILI